MTKEEIILKEKLTIIEEKKYLLENNDEYFSIALDMIENIGSLDSKLRDDLIYGTLLQWVTTGKFNFTQLEALLNISLDASHLFYKLESEDEDAVYKRTFSVLVVALVIYQLRREELLSESLAYQAKEKIIEYMLKEKDLRGYIEIKGWAHSVAHTADALDELAQYKGFNKADLLDILNVIKAKVCVNYYVYKDEESERLVNAVQNVFKRKMLSCIEITDWIQAFNIENSQLEHMEKYHLKINIKDFLRSLYFRLLEDESSKYILEEIIKVLKKLEKR